MTNYGVMPHVKGVMYRAMEAEGSCFSKSGMDEPLHLSVVLQDGLRDYYNLLRDPLAGDDIVTKFGAARGTTPENFVKVHFNGAIEGVDMHNVPYRGPAIDGNMVKK